MRRMCSEGVFSFHVSKSHVAIAIRNRLLKNLSSCFTLRSQDSRHVSVQHIAVYEDNHTLRHQNHLAFGDPAYQDSYSTLFTW